MTKRWIGVDLDGTLAHYPTTCKDTWAYKWNEIGPPIPAMVNRIREWLVDGKEVRIMTARVFPYIHGNPSFSHAYGYRQQCLLSKEYFTIAQMLEVIGKYTEKHVGKCLPATCAKDWRMSEQWDDRAIQVRLNTGEVVGDAYLARSEVLLGKAQGR